MVNICVKIDNTEFILSHFVFAKNPYIPSFRGGEKCAIFIGLYSRGVCLLHIKSVQVNYSLSQLQSKLLDGKSITYLI